MPVESIVFYFVHNVNSVLARVVLLVHITEDNYIKVHKITIAQTTCSFFRRNTFVCYCLEHSVKKKYTFKKSTYHKNNILMNIFKCDLNIMFWTLNCMLFTIKLKCIIV